MGGGAVQSDRAVSRFGQAHRPGKDSGSGEGVADGGGVAELHIGRSNRGPQGDAGIGSGVVEEKVVVLEVGHGGCARDCLPVGGDVHVPSRIGSAGPFHTVIAGSDADESAAVVGDSSCRAWRQASEAESCGGGSGAGVGEDRVEGGGGVDGTVRSDGDHRAAALGEAACSGDIDQIGAGVAEVDGDRAIYERERGSAQGADRSGGCRCDGGAGRRGNRCGGAGAAEGASGQGEGSDGGAVEDEVSCALLGECAGTDDRSGQGDVVDGGAIVDGQGHATCANVERSGTINGVGAGGGGVVRNRAERLAETVVDAESAVVAVGFTKDESGGGHEGVGGSGGESPVGDGDVAVGIAGGAHSPAASVGLEDARGAEVQVASNKSGAVAPN